MYVMEMYITLFLLISSVYFWPSQQYILSRKMIQKKMRNMTKLITKKTEKQELALLGYITVMGQKGSLKNTSNTDKTAIIFCSTIFSPSGTLLSMIRNKTQPTKDMPKYKYLITMEYLVNSGLTTSISGTMEATLSNYVVLVLMMNT